MVSAVNTLQVLERNLPKALATTAANPIVKRDTANYLKNISSVHTAKDFVSNYRIFSYAMTAYGLGDMVYAKAFMQKVLDGGVADPKSMANKLSDSRFKAFAAAFDFGDKGAAATTDSTANTTTTTRYVQQSLEDTTGEQNPGAQLALYFQRKAPTITSGLSVLADKALYQFVQTAFNLPALSSGTTVDQDAANIEKKLKIADLKDPAKLQKLISRFAVMWDLKNTSAAASSPALSILSGIQTSAGAGGLSQDLLNNAQKRYASV